VLYAGAHGIANHLWQYIDAAELLQDRDDILLVSVGDGPQKQALVEETKRRGLKNLQWIDGVPKPRLIQLLKAADAGMAILKRTDTFKTVYPNKVFDYMACGRPVLCVIDGVARELVETAGAGYFVEPEQPEDFNDKIRALAALSRAQRKAMGKRGRKYVEEHFSRDALAKRYLDAMQSLVGK